MLSYEVSFSRCSDFWTQDLTNSGSPLKSFCSRHFTKINSFPFLQAASEDSPPQETVCCTSGPSTAEIKNTGEEWLLPELLWDCRVKRLQIWSSIWKKCIQEYCSLLHYSILRKAKQGGLYLFQKQSYLSNGLPEKKKKELPQKYFHHRHLCCYHGDGTIKALQSLDWALNLGLRRDQ